MVDVSIRITPNTPLASIRKTAIYLLSLVGEEHVELPDSPLQPPAPKAHALSDVSPSEALKLALQHHYVVPLVPPPPSDELEEVDVNGLPWNDEIHTRTRSKDVGGSWKLKRGSTGPAAPNVRAVPLPPNVPEMTPPAPAPDETSFPKITQLLTQAVRDKKLNQSAILAILQSHGIQSVPLIASRPDLFDTLAAAFKQRIEEV